MGAQADRAAERRAAKIAEIEQQVKDGSLTIRQMTEAERKEHPVPPPRPPRPGSRRRTG